MSTLVVVESPAKAHTVGRILGPDYSVMASVGHVCDLPDHALGIAISPDGKTFTPEYVVPDDKKKIVDGLVRAARKADAVLLASDPDREGEAIAWHVRNRIADGLGKDAAKKTFRRVEYNEITPTAVRAAVAAPHEIDMRRVDAQQARRLLDRLVGWKVSPSLRRARGLARAGGGAALSAGRVQSVALRLVCDREKEVLAFTPVPYWDFSVSLRKAGAPETEAFVAQVTRLDGEKPQVHDEAAAAAAAAFLAAADYRVESVAKGNKKRNPGAPFTTSTLQQRASSALGFAPDLTMRLAQDLYEHSLITYMRTDSRAVSKDAQAAAGAFIRAKWGEDFAAPRTYGNKAGAQAAHECIRPTDPAVEPGSGLLAALEGVRDPDRAARLYGLIWKQFVTSQMTPAVYETVSAGICARPGAAGTGAAPLPGAPSSATLAASTARLVFPGFLQIDPERLAADAYDPERPASEADEDKGGEERVSTAVAALPPLAEGEPLDAAPPEAQRKETKPRPRFNEASLVRELERNGIGRPSTFASVVATLKNRRYVESRSRVLYPTELGTAVTDYLVPHFPELLDVAFTARMETLLDEVEDPEKALDWQGMLAEFYARLQGWLHEARGPAADPEVLRAVLSEFRNVRVWKPARRAGNRTYDDRVFVQDLANEFMGLPRSGRRSSGRKAPAGDASVPPAPEPNEAGYAFDPSRPAVGGATSRQLDALLTILVGYADQLPDLPAFLRSIGRPEAIDGAAAPRAEDPRVARLLDTLAQAGVPERSRTFFESLREQHASGRPLSPRQIRALGELLLESAARVPDFSPELCEELGVEWREPEEENPALAADLVAALGRVTDWGEAVKRGARTFDDHSFYASVATQFGAKGHLSFKQVAALRRLFFRYRDQIPDADELIARHGLEPSAARRRSSSRRGKK